MKPRLLPLLLVLVFSCQHGNKPSSFSGEHADASRADGELGASRKPESGPNELKERPNILCILVDDLGYGDLSCMGAADLQSPNIDRLADQGMVFSQFYANCTVCSPSRASLLSGLYPDRVGVPGVIRQNKANSWGNLADDTDLLPAYLKVFSKFVPPPSCFPKRSPF